MLCNFQQLHESTNLRTILLFIIILWLLIIKNYLCINHSQKPHLPIKHHQTQQILNLLNSLKDLEHRKSQIKKIQIEQHELLIFGSSEAEQAFSQLEKNLNQFIWVKHIEVKQWDFIKPGKWRFVLGIVY